MTMVTEQSDREFLRKLHRLESATVQKICTETGVTATAVRQRLRRLERHGLVTRCLVRSGRGRPHHAYTLTRNGLHELGDNYAGLAAILWREVHGIEDAGLRERLLERIRGAFVAQYETTVTGESLADRLGTLKQALSARGLDVEVDSSGELPILREHNCPYLEVASVDNGICELEQAVFSSVLGQKVELTQCCLDGHACCEFQPAAS